MFSGRLPLFPCRQGVLFPGVPLTCTVAPGPLTQLILDAMAEDGLLGVFGLRQRRRIYSCSTCDEVFIDPHSLARHQLQAHSFQPLLPAPPPASDSLLPLPYSLCLARLRRAQPLPNGGWILRILGQQRVRVQREICVEKPYRVVEATSVSSPRSFPLKHSGPMARARQVIEALRGNIGWEDPHPPGRWLDLLCQLLPISWDSQLQLLDEACPQYRYEKVSEHLGQLGDWQNSLEQHLWKALLPPRSGPN